MINTVLRMNRQKQSVKRDLLSDAELAAIVGGSGPGDGGLAKQVGINGIGYYNDSVPPESSTQPSSKTHVTGARHDVGYQAG